MKTNSLFKRFIIHSIISFLITGIILTFFVSRQIINREIDHSIQAVNLTLGHSLKHWFDDVNLKKLSKKDIQKLDKEFSSLAELDNILNIKIWSKDGSLVYNQNNYYSFEKNIDNYLKSKSNNFKNYEIISNKNNQFDDFNEIIIIYLPIKENDKIIGYYQAYKSFDSARTTINKGIINVILILFLGLIILYYFLAKKIYKSSKKLIDQKNEILLSYEKLNTLFKSMITAITKAIEARDDFTSGHSERVSENTIGFAKYLNLEDDLIDKLEIASLLHDIGKLGVPEEIINKPGKLTNEEYDIIKKHPIIGEKIVENIEQLDTIVDIIRHHHERYDGLGYPDKLKGKEIPLMARIISITDAYDAMTSTRPYRKNLSINEALLEIKNNSKKQFDPDLVESFIKYITDKSSKKNKISPN